ncbi:hypothetical protein C8046_08415 [Serinibacter arcticus]|uniref:SLH domain-containing protein n=1 Tax=Serinibacter arcticus TaxID=1655435 RepID=A0A2U1ZZP5_9MICO|nr:hypothetical protein C8046_08415 [Serinibacter arcticus]
MAVSGFDAQVLGEQVVTVTAVVGEVSRSATFTVTVTAPPQTTSPFVDVPVDSLFFREIAWLAEREISTGWELPGGEHEFRPLQPIARDAMAAFLFRLAGDEEFQAPAVSPFVDVDPSNQFYREITWLAHEGISTGWATAAGAEFRPLEPIARDAMAAFLYRLADSPAYEAPASSAFADVAPSTQFYAEISWLAENQIATGWVGHGNDGSSYYRPFSSVNRDAMAAFLFRWADKHE